MSHITNKLPNRTTHGITIEVDVQFQKRYSVPNSDQYVFTYGVKIFNGNPFTVQLLRRAWHIWESNGTTRQVKGEGVIGIQPVISPNSFHTYESYCPILAPIGRMLGKYQMIRLDTNEKFEVDIPEFHLVIPDVMN